MGNLKFFKGNNVKKKVINSISFPINKLICNMIMSRQRQQNCQDSLGMSFFHMSI
jgi:hypothetical protein